MKCNIKIISPVHIGSGDTYSASEYVKDNAKSTKGYVVDIFKRINVSKYYLSLDDDKKDELLSNLTNPSFNLTSFDDKIPKKYVQYRSIVKFKEDITPNQRISEAIKTLNQLYIPGSSLKGAINTAIIYSLVDEKKISYISDNLFNHRGRLIIGEYKKFMNSFFVSHRESNPTHGHIMRFLQVSDSTTVKTPTIYDVSTIMAHYREGFYEFFSLNKNTRKKTLSYLETIGRNNKLSFEIKKTYNDEIISKLYLDNKKYLIELDNIKRSLYVYAKALIDNELEFAEKYNIPFLEKFYSKLDKLNSVKSPLVRIGSGSGFLSTTLSLRIKKYNPDLYEQIRESLRKTYKYEFPKSRKIIQRGGMPLGWIKLTFDED